MKGKSLRMILGGVINFVTISIAHIGVESSPMVGWLINDRIVEHTLILSGGG